METVTRTALAIDGGKPAVDGLLPAFNTIGAEEAFAVKVALGRPLSGFLGGELIGGPYVQALEEEWAATFGVKHAISFNSATSALLGACVAVEVGPKSTVLTTPYTMSATAAAPAFLGANIQFGDIEEEMFSLAPKNVHADAVVIVNLFGHPAWLTVWGVACRGAGVPLIEDNSQSPFAKEYGRYAGTVGDIGVFSGNIHKIIQCGEGGMAVTNDGALADKLRMFRNHGEMAGYPCGLNLRLTEIQAAIWLVQLRKAPEIIANRVEVAETVIDAAKCVPGLRGPVVREGCSHVYYCVPFLLNEFALGMTREWFVRAMRAEGVPLREGYLLPLYALPAFERFKSSCPVAEHVEEEMILYENCWSPSPEQLGKFKDAFARVVGSI